MILPSFEGVTIDRIFLSTLIQIRLSNKWAFALEGTWFLTRDGHPTEELPLLIVEEPVESPPELAFLVGKQITSVVVAPEGHLAINVDGAQLALRADPRYEAWRLHGPRGEMLLCGVDGEMCSWGPRF
jgi:hypothetical protein